MRDISTLRQQYLQLCHAGGVAGSGSVTNVGHAGGVASSSSATNVGHAGGVASSGSVTNEACRWCC
jgi:hypothetical protein